MQIRFQQVQEFIRIITTKTLREKASGFLHPTGTPLYRWKAGILETTHERMTGFGLVHLSVNFPFELDDITTMLEAYIPPIVPAAVLAQGGVAQAGTTAECYKSKLAEIMSVAMEYNAASILVDIDISKCVPPLVIGALTKTKVEFFLNFYDALVHYIAIRLIDRTNPGTSDRYNYAHAPRSAISLIQKILDPRNRMVMQAFYNFFRTLVLESKPAYDGVEDLGRVRPQDLLELLCLFTSETVGRLIMKAESTRSRAVASETSSFGLPKSTIRDM